MAVKKEKAERLFNEIGKVNDYIVTEGQKPRQKALKAALFCAAAAALIFMVWFIIPKEKPNLLDYSRLPFEYSAGNQSLEKLDPNTIAGGMGYEWLMGYDISDVTGNNPVNLDKYSVTELPAFRMRGEDHGQINDSLTQEQMEERLRVCAERLGFDPDSIIFTDKDLAMIISYLETPDGNIRLSVTSEGSMWIVFETPIALPDGYSLTNGTGADDIKTAEKTLDYLMNKYSEVIGFENPVPDISGNYDNVTGEYLRRYEVYEGSDDPFTSLYNYSFKKACFSADEQGRLERISITDNADTMDCVGIYPTIDYESAAQKLLEGYYASPLRLKYDITEDMIKYCELVYHRTNRQIKYQMPYYRFIIREPDDRTALSDLNSYLGVYVPAIQSDYLTELDN